MRVTGWTHIVVLIFFSCITNTRAAPTPLPDDYKYRLNVTKIASITYNDDEYFSKPYVRSMAFTRNGKFLNVGIASNEEADDKHLSSKGKFYTYDLTDYKKTVEIAKIDGRKAYWYVPDNDYNHDGSLLALCINKNNVDVYNTTHQKKPELLKTINLPPGEAQCVKFSPEKKLLVVGGSNGTFRIYGMTNPKEPELLSTTITEPHETLDQVIFSADEETIIFSGDNLQLRTYNISNPDKPVEVVTVMHIDNTPTEELGSSYLSYATGLASTPDSGLIATTKASYVNSLHVFNMKEPDNPEVQKIMGRYYFFVDFSRNGKLMITGTAGEDGGLTIFDTKNFYPQSFIKTGAMVGKGAFSPTEDLLFFDGGDGTIWVYKYSWSAVLKHSADHPWYQRHKVALLAGAGVGIVVLVTMAVVYVVHVSSRKNRSGYEPL